MENEFIDKVGCRLPFMDQMVTNQTMICGMRESVSDYFHFWKAIQNTSADERFLSDCAMIKRCIRSDYELFESHEMSIFNDTITFNLIPLTSTVQYVKDEYAYDAQSFIGEVGGTLGLMLGLSFTSIFDFIEYVLTKLSFL